ncbi:hypothetical protein J1N35_030657 [Gossypium stocksii]|uniref:Uncharacterized protein n=1 Tax=Gossypium stocksii TaxID=47602 RepID=A0A9D3UZK9_9ROSI|nr:hypothetical protein J1N35_030657 [Gossypium stocksii]
MRRGNREGYALECIVGLQMVRLTLASFLQAFDISTPSTAVVDMTEDAGLSNMKATPVEVIVKPRPLSRVLYE